MIGEAVQYRGLWQRLLLSVPASPVDTRTQVGWLQGPRYYVDLRQPPAELRQVKARCLNELLPDEARLLATQEGFAGQFRLIGDEAEWLREIDYLPPGPLGDRGRLEDHGDLLIEHGIEADYTEYWQRDPVAADAPSAAACFLTEDDCLVILVQHGSNFGYARNRRLPLGKGESLIDRLYRADIRETRALMDCEIALGTITAQGWRIHRSTLPWREGTILLRPGIELAAAQLDISDLDASGRPFTRSLRLLNMHGTFEYPFEARPVVAEVAGANGAGPFLEVPVVDIAALGSRDRAAEVAAVEQLRRAAREVGFLYITGHGIAPAVTERMQASARRFFGQPLERKLASYIGQSSNHRGYVPEGEESFMAGKRDRKEAFDLALDLPADAVPADHPMLGPNQWPDLPGFREDVMAYYAATFSVGQKLLRGLAMALGQPADCLDRLIVNPPSQLRLIHYPFQPDATDAPGIGAHTDYECFTLLLATGPGLEVMNQAGEWIDAPPVPGALVVNIGDMMEFWSGGAFVATSHRVRKVAEERYSFPLFFAVDYDVELRPADRPANGESIRTGEHIFAQTVQTFRYLKERSERGEIALPPAARPLSSFGQQVRHHISSPSPA